MPPRRRQQLPPGFLETLQGIGAPAPAPMMFGNTSNPLLASMPMNIPFNPTSYGKPVAPDAGDIGDYLDTQLQMIDAMRDPWVGAMASIQTGEDSFDWPMVYGMSGPGGTNPFLAASGQGGAPAAAGGATAGAGGGGYGTPGSATAAQNMALSGVGPAGVPGTSGPPSSVGFQGGTTGTTGGMTGGSSSSSFTPEIYSTATWDATANSQDPLIQQARADIAKGTDVETVKNSIRSAIAARPDLAPADAVNEQPGSALQGVFGTVDTLFDEKWNFEKTNLQNQQGQMMATQAQEAELNPLQEFASQWGLPMGQYGDGNWPSDLAASINRYMPNERKELRQLDRRQNRLQEQEPVYAATGFDRNRFLAEQAERTGPVNAATTLGAWDDVPPADLVGRVSPDMQRVPQVTGEPAGRPIGVSGPITYKGPVSGPIGGVKAAQQEQQEEVPARYASAPYGGGNGGQASGYGGGAPFSGSGQASGYGGYERQPQQPGYAGYSAGGPYGEYGGAPAYQAPSSWEQSANPIAQQLTGLSDQSQYLQDYQRRSQNQYNTMVQNYLANQNRTPQADALNTRMNWLRAQGLPL